MVEEGPVQQPVRCRRRLRHGLVSAPHELVGHRPGVLSVAQDLLPLDIRQARGVRRGDGVAHPLHLGHRLGQLVGVLQPGHVVCVGAGDLGEHSPRVGLFAGNQFSSQRPLELVPLGEQLDHELLEREDRGVNRRRVHAALGLGVLQRGAVLGYGRQVRRRKHRRVDLVLHRLHAELAKLQHQGAVLLLHVGDAGRPLDNVVVRVLAHLVAPLGILRRPDVVHRVFLTRLAVCLQRSHLRRHADDVEVADTDERRVGALFGCALGALDGVLKRLEHHVDLVRLGVDVCLSDLIPDCFQDGFLGQQGVAVVVQRFLVDRLCLGSQ